MNAAELQEAQEWEAAGKRQETAAPSSDGPESGPSGDLRPLIQHLSACFDAIVNCQNSGNQEWESIWTDRIEALCKEHLPSGSGFDAGTSFDHDSSRADRLCFQTSFHHMNDSGYYDGWTEHRVIAIPTFRGFDLKITGRDKRAIKDYIGETFHNLLSAPVRLSDLDC